MPQPAPTSPLDSRYTPNDEVRFDLHKAHERLVPYEHVAAEREINEATKLALAAASGKDLAENAINTIAGVEAAKEKGYEVRRISIAELHKVGGVLRHVRDEKLAA